MGVATGWLWEDLGFAGVKTGVRQVEGFIEGWNGGKDGKEGEEAVKVVPLRRTGYLSVSEYSALFFSHSLETRMHYATNKLIFRSPAA